MNGNQEIIARTLIRRGTKLLNGPYREIMFTEHPEANKLLNDLKCHPHAFVLACVMDRQVKAERAWAIPYEISKEIKGFEFHRLRELTERKIRNIFRKRRLHRFNDDMSRYFYLAVQKIHSDYDGIASRIWADKPGSASVVRRFLEFHGVGIKIATMAANILARDFKIPMADHLCIDVSPDVHVLRVFMRLGFIPKDSGGDMLIYTARELNPEFPGIFDLSCWEIGRNWCRPSKPLCSECLLNANCPKII